jgi:carbon-monoxide dehydrogenase large subunit
MASGGPTVNTINFGTGAYKIEHYAARSRVVVTNTVPVDAYRGYGRPEGAYIAERAIDAVARHLNLDQVEVRRRNFIQPADFPYRPYNGPATIYDSGNYTASSRQWKRSITNPGATSAINCAPRAAIAASG